MPLVVGMGSIFFVSIYCINFYMAVKECGKWDFKKTRYYLLRSHGAWVLWKLDDKDISKEDLVIIDKYIRKYVWQTAVSIVFVFSVIAVMLL